MPDLSKIPTWLLGVGVLAVGLAVIWVFVFPGNGIDVQDKYIGPHRAESQLSASALAHGPFKVCHYVLDLPSGARVAESVLMPSNSTATRCQAWSQKVWQGSKWQLWCLSDVDQSPGLSVVSDGNPAYPDNDFCGWRSAGK